MLRLSWGAFPVCGQYKAGPQGGGVKKEVGVFFPAPGVKHRTVQGESECGKPQYRERVNGVKLRTGRE